MATVIAAAEPAFGAPETYAQTDPDEVQAGMGVIQQAGCGACHTIPGIPGAAGVFGPNLGPTDTLPPVSARSMIASYPDGPVPNNTVDDLAAWIANAPSLKPGTAMPNLGLPLDAAHAAAAYLYAIQPDGTIATMDGSDGSTPPSMGADPGNSPNTPASGG